MRHLRVWIVVVAVAAVAVAGATGARAGAGHGITISFQKQLVDPTNLVFEGTTGGAVKGTVSSQVVPGTLSINGDLWSFDFDWSVTADAPAKSFTVHASGTMIGADDGSPVSMDGVVTRGWHAGAAFQMQGTLVDASTFTIEGTLTILPDNSGS